MKWLNHEQTVEAINLCRRVRFLGASVSVEGVHQLQPIPISTDVDPESSMTELDLLDQAVDRKSGRNFREQ